MRVLDSYHPGWSVTETWRPRPTTDPAQLVPYLAELTSRELARAGSAPHRVLRLDTVVDDCRWQSGQIAPDWLRLDDAVQAIMIACAPPTESALGWLLLHAVRGDGHYPLGLLGRPEYGFLPTRLSPSPAPPVPPCWPELSAPITDLPEPDAITLYWAAGPLGTATILALRDGHRLTVTDATTLAEASQRPPQSVGAPVTETIGALHAETVVDVTRFDQVLAAAEGADCLVNVSVVRNHVELAFGVNVVGSLNVIMAAAKLGIRRVVFTGPTLALGDFPYGNNEDREVPSTTPSPSAPTCIS